MFDWVEITVRAGHGGDGAVSFRREKFVPYGGPDGGDGGDGGSVIVMADPSVDGLSWFKYRKYYKAGDGAPGKSKKKHGRSGDDRILNVPVGTVISNKMQIGDGSLIADLERPGQHVVIAKGGRGGWGNSRFVSPTNQVPRIAQKGEDGEELTIVLELRLIADVGIIGYPNSGKSTLLAAASAAKPEIASYPFTTRSPVLGIVEIGSQTFILAEIPGLIEGAHIGRGLGHEFLRHVTRTKLLIHLVDGTSPSPLENMRKLNAELTLYDSSLAQKRQLMVVNKVDLPEVRAELARIENSFATAGVRVFFISAVTGEGVSELVAEAMQALQGLTPKEAERRAPQKIFHPRPRSARTAVHKEDDTFVVVAPGLDRIVTRGGETGSGVYWQLRQQFDRQGITKALIRAGIKSGDMVRCGELEWEWE